MQPQNVSKPPFIYLFYRSYCFVALIAWNAYGVCEFFSDSIEFKPFSPLELTIIPAIYMVFSLLAFRFNYSVFGQFKRTPWPQEEPLCRARLTCGRVALMSATVPFFNWYAFPSGLGFTIMGVGRGFVPYDCITEVKKGSFFSAGSKITHSWPEVRSPLVMPYRRMYDVVASKVPELGAGCGNTANGR
jgi:hypothetical protein